MIKQPNQDELIKRLANSNVYGQNIMLALHLALKIKATGTTGVTAGILHQKCRVIPTIERKELLRTLIDCGFVYKAKRVYTGLKPTTRYFWRM